VFPPLKLLHVNPGRGRDFLSLDVVKWQFLMAFSDLGATARQKNFWSGDAFRVVGASVETLTLEGMVARARVSSATAIGRLGPSCDAVMKECSFLLGGMPGADERLFREGKGV
jgi:hypothetical protein